MTLEEAWAAYEATLPALEDARLAHDEAYKASTAAYRVWLNLGGKHEHQFEYKTEDMENDS